MSEIIRVATGEISSCVERLEALKNPTTSEELFAGSTPVTHEFVAPIVDPQSYIEPAIQHYEQEPMSPLAANVLELLVDNFNKCRREQKPVNPMFANQLRELLRPENRPPSKGRQGKTFTSLLQQIPGVRTFAFQRVKNGKLLPAEPAFALTEEAISYLQV